MTLVTGIPTFPDCDGKHSFIESRGKNGFWANRIMFFSNSIHVEKRVTPVTPVTCGRTTSHDGRKTKRKNGSYRTFFLADRPKLPFGSHVERPFNKMN